MCGAPQAKERLGSYSVSSRHIVTGEPITPLWNNCVPTYSLLAVRMNLLLLLLELRELRLDHREVLLRELLHDFEIDLEDLDLV